MKVKEKLNGGLCKLSNIVVTNGASLLVWGEKEIPESLRKMYEKEQEVEHYENKGQD